MAIVVALDPREPRDIDLFTSIYLPGPVEGLYPTGEPMTPAASATLSEDDARAALRDAYSGGSCGGVDLARALDFYDDDRARAMVPDHDLRAALASLEGTVWEPTVDHLLNSGRFTGSRYGGIGTPSSARSSANLGDGTNTIIFNRRYQGEDFRLKRPLWSHEVGHDDLPDTVAEEAVLHAFTAMVYLQDLCTDPTLAYADTELTRQMNDFALQFLNSHDPGSSHVAIRVPGGTETAPGSPRSSADFWSLIETFDPVTRGQSASPMSTSVTKVLPSLGIDGSEDYDEAAADAFRNLDDSWLSDVERLRVEVLLQMITVDETAAVLNRPPSEVVESFGLTDVIDAIDGSHK